MSFQYAGQWQVFDKAGRRKYLTPDERQRFLAAADRAPKQLRALFYVLAYTGCRITEALSLTRHQLDDGEAIIFRTLKRRRLAFRRVPVPAIVIDMLLKLDPAPDGRLWTMHRTTAWRHVTAMLTAIGVEGPMRCCRGLRHAFGLNAAASSVPPSLIQRWMGHASPTTTMIYLDIIGAEERQFAGRMWLAPGSFYERAPRQRGRREST